MEGFTIASIITTVGEILTAFIGWLGTVFDFLISNPLALFGIISPFALVLVPKGLKLVRYFFNKRRV